MSNREQEINGVDEGAVPRLLAHTTPAQRNEHTTEIAIWLSIVVAPLLLPPVLLVSGIMRWVKRRVGRRAPSWRIRA